jgi:hypothetical protein
MPDPILPILPKVTVQFFGICTHMTPQGNSEAPPHWGHRVVLVNARNPQDSPHPAIRSLNPHIARLQLKAKDVVGPLTARPWFPVIFNDGETIEWDLAGVLLSIENALPKSAATTIDCIPHLSACCLILSPAGPATYADDRAKTSCFFDFGDAEFEGRRHGDGASMGVLGIWTTDSPRLLVKNFGSDGEQIGIGILPGAEVSVSNIPIDSTADKEQDFFFHFLTAERFPEEIVLPPGSTCAKPLVTYNPPRHLGDITGPGCSNSAYP